jgi:hypothetical protein
MATAQDRKDGEKVAVKELARSISAAMPTLDVTDQQIAIATYRLLAGGKPVATEAIAGAVGVPVARVEAALESWPGVYRDDASRVAGFWGLAIAPLDPEYRLQIDGET